MNNQNRCLLLHFFFLWHCRSTTEALLGSASISMWETHIHTNACQRLPPCCRFNLNRQLGGAGKKNRFKCENITLWYLVQNDFQDICLSKAASCKGIFQTFQIPLDGRHFIFCSRIHAECEHPLELAFYATACLCYILIISVGTFLGSVSLNAWFNITGTR